MTVSNKDRRMAVKAVDRAIGEWCDENHLGPLTRNVLNATIVNALIAHGWGPRPTVPAGKINDWLEVAVYAIDNADAEIRADLAALGIEVSDG